MKPYVLCFMVRGVYVEQPIRFPDYSTGNEVVEASVAIVASIHGADFIDIREDSNP